MKPSSVAIILCSFIYGTNAGMFASMYWISSKTEKLHADISNFTSCMVNAGTFPDFHLNTVEGDRLDQLRLNMFRLSKCTIWNVAACGPYNYLKACYQLMMLLVKKPSLISELAASPFRCAFGMICDMWPNYPKIHCVDGTIVAPPSTRNIGPQVFAPSYGQEIPYRSNTAHVAPQMSATPYGPGIPHGPNTAPAPPPMNAPPYGQRIPYGPNTAPVAPQMNAPPYAQMIPYGPNVAAVVPTITDPQNRQGIPFNPNSAAFRPQESAAQYGQRTPYMLNAAPIAPHPNNPVPQGSVVGYQQPSLPVVNQPAYPHSNPGNPYSNNVGNSKDSGLPNFEFDFEKEFNMSLGINN